MKFLIANNININKNINDLKLSGRKSSVQHYFKKNYGITIQEYISSNYNNDLINSFRCPICNEISKKGNYDFYLEGTDLYLNDKNTENSIFLCDGTESRKSFNCKKNRKGINPNSVEFIKLIYKVSDSEARKIINERNSSPFYRHNHASEKDYANYQRRSKEWFKEHKTEEDYVLYREKLKYVHSEQYYIDSMGEIDGKNHWKSLSEKKKSCSLDSKIERYGKVAGTELYHDHLKKVKQNQENFILRYGTEEGTKKWEEYCKNSPFYNKARNKMCVEYWISQGFPDPENARLEFIKTRPTFSKQYCINKYGEIEGIDRWEQYCRKQCDALSRGTASLESLDNFYSKLINLIPVNLNFFIGAYGKSEYFIMDSDYGYRLYDFTIPEIKVIIEYHGSLWHYNESNLLESPFRTLEERKEVDRIKKLVAEKAGFDYYVVFDTDNFDEKADQLSKIIKEKIYGRK